MAASGTLFSGSLANHGACDRRLSTTCRSSYSCGMPPIGPEPIRVSKVDPHPLNPRIGVPEKIIDALASQMRDRWNPWSLAITVRRKGNRFEVVSGHLRLEAAKRAEIKWLQAWVEDLSDEDALLRLALDNVQQPLTPLEHGLAYLQAIEHGVHITQREYASQTGYRPPNFSRYVKAARVFQAIRPAFENDNVIISSCRDLAEQLCLIGLAPQELWPDLVVRCVEEGWTKRGTKKQVRLLLEEAARKETEAGEDEGEAVADAVEKGDGGQADDPSKGDGGSDPELVQSLFSTFARVVDRWSASDPANSTRKLGQLPEDVSAEQTLLHIRLYVCMSRTVMLYSGASKARKETLDVIRDEIATLWKEGGLASESVRKLERRLDQFSDS